MQKSNRPWVSCTESKDGVPTICAFSVSTSDHPVSPQAQRKISIYKENQRDKGYLFTAACLAGSMLAMCEETSQSETLLHKWSTKSNKKNWVGPFTVNFPISLESQIDLLTHFYAHPEKRFKEGGGIDRASKR